jgi:hypothetical protein
VPDDLIDEIIEAAIDYGAAHQRHEDALAEMEGTAEDLAELRVLYDLHRSTVH